MPPTTPNWRRTRIVHRQQMRITRVSDDEVEIDVGEEIQVEEAGTYPSSAVPAVHLQLTGVSDGRRLLPPRRR